jgi:hypothetical protein
MNPLASCPSCGKRWGVELMCETLVERENTTFLRDRTMSIRQVFGGPSLTFGSQAGLTGTYWSEAKTEYTAMMRVYQCKNCHDRWIDIVGHDDGSRALEHIGLN